MIVVSVGMIKSGSAWYFHMTNDLLVAAGHQNAHDIKQRFHLQAVMKYKNCLLSGMLWQKALILVPSLLGNTFAVKTHGPPNAKLCFLLDTGLAKATYIFRDPRDVVVSVFERAQKKRAQGLNGAFTNLDTVESAILCVRRELESWDKWKRYNKALPVRYEDVLNNPVRELERLAHFLSLDVPLEELKAIVQTYRPENLPNIRQEKGGLHFNKGIAGRFRRVLTPEQLHLCHQQFEEYLQRMGYAD